MALKRLEEAPLEGKKILVRFDFNVPIDEKTLTIRDTSRIDACLPTIRYLLQRKASKVIMMSHLGRPKGKKSDKDSLEPIARYLADQLKEEVILTESCLDTSIPTLINLPQTKLVLLENLRFHPEEEGNDHQFAAHLATYADLYVNDAFGVSHRKHASVYEIVHFFSQKSYGGPLLVRETQVLEEMLKAPKRPFVAVLGGAKVSDKIHTISALLTLADQLLIGGAMAYPFLQAKGFDIGKSKYQPEDLELAQSLLRQDRGGKIQLPLDHVTVENWEAAQATDPVSKIIDARTKSDLGSRMALDIGPSTLEHYNDVLKKAKTVFWNGPMGYYESPTFAKGTLAIAQQLAALSEQTYTIVGGGDSVTAVKQSGLEAKFGHLSTGGGASLEFIEQGTLPGIQALKFGVQ